MPPRPHVQPLSRKSRTVIFGIAVLLFVVSVPLFVLYAIGYRIDLDADTQNFRTVGGMYVSTESDAAAIYVDEERIEDMRLFQQAAYIQNLYAGMHRIHTQGEDIQTWVKDLPVYPHLVTQAASFNMPATSTVRFVAPYETATGTPLYSKAKKDQPLFTETLPEVAPRFTTAPLSSVGVPNPEYEFLSALFASTTATRAALAKQLAYEEQSFSFKPQPARPTSTATTTRQAGDYLLFKNDDDVFVSWQGTPGDVPYYFCVFTDSYASTSAQYGEHVADQLFTTAGAIASTTLQQNNQLCRTQIKIDRKWQEVLWYEFMPGDPNLVLMHLTDGIYVVEVDDRSWQNVQQLYAGTDITMLTNGGQIFVRAQDVYFELLTEPLVQ